MPPSPTPGNAAMNERPIDVLLRANRRAGEIRREQAPAGGGAGPGVLVGAPSHSGAHLLQALDEQGWEIRPKTNDGLEPSAALAERVVAVAHQGIGLDDIHRSLSPAVVLAVLQLIEAAGLVVMEDETR